MVRTPRSDKDLGHKCNLRQHRQRLNPLAASLQGHVHREVVPHTWHVQGACALCRVARGGGALLRQCHRDGREDLEWRDLTSSAAASSDDQEMDDTVLVHLGLPKGYRMQVAECGAHVRR